MPAKPTLVHRDPNTLKVHSHNVRRDLGDLRPMVRSIQESGVLVPLLIVPDGDGETVIFGHRRQAAAVLAECVEVPCILRRDLQGDAEQISRMVIENLHREPLSAAVEAAAYEQLSVLGLSDTAIARSTGTSRAHVTKARKVAASDVASTVADRYDLSLDQALVLAEFEDDRDAVKTLTVTARQNPGQFAHLASRLRQDRDAAQARQAVIDRLRDAGVTVVERRELPTSAASLRDLTDADDNTPIVPVAHVNCPGHVAHVPHHRPDDIEFFCLDPDASGHRSRHATTGRPTPTPMTDEAKAERREVIENNKAWRAAESVRHDFIRGLLARRTPPKGTLRYATTVIVSRPDRVGNATESTLAGMLGLDGQTRPGRTIGATHLSSVADARLPLALLAQVVADNEQTIGVHTWRNPSTEVAAWFEFLHGAGYVLSDIEQHVIDSAAAKRTAQSRSTA